MVYGLTISDVENDPLLGSKRHSLIEIAVKKLHQIGMIIFDQVTGSLDPTELGSIASKYYIKHSTVEIFNQLFRPKMTEADVSCPSPLILYPVWRTSYSVLFQLTRQLTRRVSSHVNSGASNAKSECRVRSDQSPGF